MLEISKIVAAGLLNDTVVNGVVSTKVFPLVADQDTVVPFIVYHVAEQPEETKDRSSRYVVTVLSYEKTYDKALELNNAVIAVMQQIDRRNKTYRFSNQGGSPQLDQQRNIYIEQKFNILK